MASLIAGILPYVGPGAGHKEMELGWPVTRKQRGQVTLHEDRGHLSFSLL